ncbi:M20 family metallopeptidase [Saccharopolyspora erythraea]|uniref:Hydrolase, Ama/HipO/HyuC family n=1 Tax=Saccharopolyspora erythraea (strain ATCC 11635 / DSM 40517 / JCM 4748 / NBRC 13426 / NCIMB 8594 / NRRL 2338) TaxID=405948 RepID=A4FLC4_SACEN|nr:peptidase M20 [Saccharopolyspora erythraea D]CAM04849.1 hydrolase, Ama/HipO/HyuC family [Saccharopolyspora erythraea NRRL 2338]
MQPDDSYLRSVAESTARAVAAAEPVGSGFDGADPALHRRVESWLDAHGADLVELSRDLHAHPEEGFAEHRSVRQVAELLRRHGFDAEVGVGGLETALRVDVGYGDEAKAGLPGSDSNAGSEAKGRVPGSDAGSGGAASGPAGSAASGGVGVDARTRVPHVAFLAEYDALPGIGHGCGHNIICCSAVGGFLAAASALAAEDGGIPGRVSLIGTPAEEGGGGKEHLARAGVFDDVDAVVMLHPFSHDIAAHPFLGRRQVEVIFHGIAAHASAQPFMGRNALDAVVATYQGVAALRQHMPSTDRVHGIITDGGQRPNIVPERAAALFYLRSSDPGTLRELAGRVEAIASGAAEMTGCGLELRWDQQPAYMPIRHNDALAGRWARHQAERGRTALPRGVVPEHLTGSTDLGNLSYRMPAIHAMIGLEGENLSLHTAEFAAAAGSETGDRAVLDGAYGLASTALDYLGDADLREAAHAEFERAGGAVNVAAYFE